MLAIVAIESGARPVVGSEDYQAMLQNNIPVVFYYGDYIGEEFSDVPVSENVGNDEIYGLRFLASV